MSFLLNNQSDHQKPEEDAAGFMPSSIIIMAVFTVTLVLGLPGNALVIWVAGLKMKRTVNTVWFLNLAIADFVCCLSLPFSIAHEAMHGYWPYGDVFCKVLPAIIILNMFASVFVLVAISLDRCLLVIKPVWSQNHRTVGMASWLCLGIWILAFLTCVPVFVYRQTYHDYSGNIECTYNYEGSYFDYIVYGDYFGVYDDNDRVKDLSFETSGETTESDTFSMTSDHLYTTIEGILESKSLGVSTRKPDLSMADWSDPRWPSGLAVTADYSSSRLSNVHPMHESGNHTDALHVHTIDPLTVITFTRLIFGFVIPLAVILACYAFILIRVRTAHFSKSSGKMQRTVLSIVSAFFICWAPYHIMGVVLLYTDSPSLYQWDHLFQGLAYANSCVNPVLYVFTGKDFKDKLRKSLHAVFESAFIEDVSGLTATTRSKSSREGKEDITIV
ncbi:C3a anaphylatoxin chemotactic receptor-like [Lissotriton helveticus]